MIPTAHDYYRARAAEHRRLARAAFVAEQRAMHDRLAEAYCGLAERHKRKQGIDLVI